jgi:hypothetical protein
MSEEEQVRIEDLRPGDLVMPGLAHAAFDAERVYSVVMYREGALTLCSPEEEGELRIDYQPEEYISRLRDSHQASEQVVPGINLDCPTFHQIRDFRPGQDCGVLFVGRGPSGMPPGWRMAIAPDGSGWFPLEVLENGHPETCVRCGSEIRYIASPPARQPARTARPQERTKGSPEQESLRQRWEQRLLRDHGPEWLEQNRERLDAEWEWILHMGL